MRLRNVKGAKELLANHDKVIEEPWLYKGKWRELFQNDNPIHIEIGMGRGKFVTTLAQQNDHINYIGIEKYSSLVAKAIYKLDRVEKSNAMIIRMDAHKIEEVFQMNEINEIYLNFSDPWPKDRHAKRRLTHSNFLNKYSRILTKNGAVCFKTDNKDLFDFSLSEFKKNQWLLKNITYNLHHSDFEGNVMTEYEERFLKMGKPIYRVEALQKQ
ncbi:tRNA (guanine-N7-)-methyltransferase [Natranaerovirga hydrolytica]|uniref:tRNA (guanine-N(7)-)-methyltransferase n=1 Tax=Natranaerovirga hydrolytica TaxID=680378 RepID=A0A4R1M3T7_9FIRM|nr:tRNA (guanosine(46)-N7)-methyltransferase TrmB [Natranaerovirga hydrolytica]TCK86766.1 tRNA (guanine-N7-)-methyltransferase [Natranaerovirga hydrolytica]